jgi:hypothetical protein
VRPTERAQQSIFRRSSSSKPLFLAGSKNAEKLSYSANKVIILSIRTTKSNLSLTNKIWFSPVNVIYHFKKLESEGKIAPSKKHYRKYCEAFITAISLVGVIKMLGRKFWMQIVDDSEGSPDVRTGCYEKKIRGNDFAIVDVEVVTYDINSPENLVDFLLRTKLSDTKGYDNLTTILCHINKITNYRMVQIYPTVELDTTFDVIAECKARTYNGVLVLNKGANRIPEFKSNQEEKHYPFENLGII